MISLRILFAALLAAAGLALFDAFAPDAQAGIGSYFSGMNSRSRVVQICFVTMAIALLIMMKKFVPQESSKVHSRRM